MVLHVKTTVDIDDHLLTRAKEAARKRKTTLRRLIEEGLRHELAQSPKQKRFRLRDASFKGGRGLQPGIDLSNPDQMLELMYGDRV
jgi:hypothetical protein